MTKNSSRKKQQCVHHWIIEAPHSRTSVGVCKHCGEVREFSNDWLNPYLTTQNPVEENGSFDAESLFPEEVT